MAALWKDRQFLTHSSYPNNISVMDTFSLYLSVLSAQWSDPLHFTHSFTHLVPRCLID